MEIQLGFWESIFDLFGLTPIYLIGAFLVGIVTILVTKKNKLSYQIVILLTSLILFFYMSMTFRNIFGTPQLSEFRRLAGFGEKLFNPNINMLPYTDGISLTYILNIIVFIPIGFLCPIISKTYGKLKYAILLGFCVSLLIETSQLFVVFRASDIDDLTANTLGMIVGFFVFKAIMKITKNRFLKFYDERTTNTWILPIMIVLTAFVNNFFA